MSGGFGGYPPGGGLTSDEIAEVLRDMATAWEVDTPVSGGTITIPVEDMNAAVWIKNPAPLASYNVIFPAGEPGIFLTITADMPVGIINALNANLPDAFTVASPKGVLLFQCMEPGTWRYITASA